MDLTRTVTIDNRASPVALRRSIKVSRNSSLHRSCNLKDNSALRVAEPAIHTNHETDQIDDQSTYINIDTKPQTPTAQSKHIKLVIRNSHSAKPLDNNEQDLYLATLIDEFQTTLNKKDCSATSCYRFKLLSYRLTQTLFERMSIFKKELLQVKRTDSFAMSHQSSDKHNNPDRTGAHESNTLDQDSLMTLVNEKEKRIQDLERLVEDQKALRLQDASLVEEKAARIKEWVANKLKELENQNRQLRDQNRKQKETVQSLHNRLATMSPISSPRRINIESSSVQYIDQASPIEAIDTDKPQRPFRNHMNKTLKSLPSSSEDENQNLVSDIEPHLSRHNNYKEKLNSPKSSLSLRNNDRESPIYDSVTLDQTNCKRYGANMTRITEKEAISQFDAPKPPPPPLHQSDKWEVQLYNLAEETFSTLLKQSEIANNLHDSSSKLDSIESHKSSLDTCASRKSSSSLKIDLISLVKPSFTTIDGEQVVDGTNCDVDLDQKSIYESSNYTSSNDLSHQSTMQFVKARKDSIDSMTENSEKAIVPSFFDSPMKPRLAKDRMLRTQSIRRNPAPEKLYDILVSDLIKRGFLIKPGALKNHNRWFVLKNFYLHSYKSESDELSKSNPNIVLKLNPSCLINQVSQAGENSYPFKILCDDKTFQFVAESAQARDEWIRILTVTINLSDMTPETLTKDCSIHEGLVNVTRQGLGRRCHAILIGHIVFFLKSLTDPTPLNYISVKGAKIREITDSYNDDFTQHQGESYNGRNNLQDCSLAIYPKYSLSSDPIYLTLGSQQDTDEWFHFLALASGVDQSYGTPFEQTISKLMINNSLLAKKKITEAKVNPNPSPNHCWWKDHSIVLYHDKPIAQPLTSLPNETLKTEAVELFKSLLLFTQVPLEPLAIDYHVCLLQNCLSRFLKYPELRNEFYAQLIKQCTYVWHSCGSTRISRGSSENSFTERLSMDSTSYRSNGCHFITDVQMLDSIMLDREIKIDADPAMNQAKFDANPAPPSQSELLQVIQILAITVSLNLPRGRMRWWLKDYLSKFANPETCIGKYAIYALKAMDRTTVNGGRDNVPSRTEIMSILLRNPYDHSNPHSLPVNFADGSYLVVEADGSTTVEEFIGSISKNMNIRQSSLSDFYLFADDPSGTKDLHILEPHRKILDVVGWWEQSFRVHNSGRYQNTRVIKFTCKKRLLLQAEDGETQHERLLIVHQMHQEIVTQKIQLGEVLTLELAAIMAQMTYGDLDKSKDLDVLKCILEKLLTWYVLIKSSQIEDDKDNQSQLNAKLVNSWKKLAGKTALDCVRVYLNCVRRLKISES